MDLSVLSFITLCESMIISIKISIKNGIQVNFILCVFYNNLKKNEMGLMPIRLAKIEKFYNTQFGKDVMKREILKLWLEHKFVQ